ncbi:MAG TPA: hypothetical protein ENN19_18720 [Chloroflexi bacterium]|nr:hypothetical protein [Chloroflexota bacterium]
MNDDNHTQTTECRLTIERLLVYLDEPDPQRVDLNEVINHMRACPFCESGLEYLIRALATDTEDLLTCGACQALLPEYLQAEMAGRAQDEAWREAWSPVTFHLETCPYCAAVYASLFDLVALAQGERGAEPPSYPEPDLPFLELEPEEARRAFDLTWKLNELGHVIIQLAEGAARALERVSSQPAYAAVKSGAERALGQFTLEEAVEDLAVILEIEKSRDDAAYCIVIVTVDIPSKGGWPNLAGSKVILRYGEEELGTQWTDAFGTAVFEDVQRADLERLTFEIVPSAE